MINSSYFLLLFLNRRTFAAHSLLNNAVHHTSGRHTDDITKYIARQQGYPTAFFLPEYVNEDASSDLGDVDMGRLDPLFSDAARLIVIHQQGSTSLIQRKFAIGYNRAGRIMDQLEKAGIVGPSEGSKARQVMCLDENDLEMRLNNLQ